MGKKTIGIIGGMGPLATADLFSKIVENTDAACDSQHAHVIIDNMPTIPSRVDAIKGTGPSPLSAILSSADRLKLAGADFFIMPCNTAHFWYSEIRARSGMDCISIIDETVKFVAEKGIKSVGLLATDGTLQAGVYQKALAERGIHQIVPTEAGQQELMRLVFQCVKAGTEPGGLSFFQDELKRMQDSGAEQMIAGCTELPILFQRYLPQHSIVDATEILAIAAVRYAGYPVKGK